MFEFLATCIVALITGFVGLSILRVTFYSLHPGNRFWQIKKSIALKYAVAYDNNYDNVPRRTEINLTDKLNNALNEAELADNQPRQYQIIDQVYKLIGSKSFMFNLWDCKYCFCSFWGLLFFPMISFAIWICSPSLLLEDYLALLIISYGSSLGFHDLIPKDLI